VLEIRCHLHSALLRNLLLAVTHRQREAKRYDNRIDIYFASHSDARRFGIRKIVESKQLQVSIVGSRVVVGPKTSFQQKKKPLDVHGISTGLENTQVLRLEGKLNHDSLKALIQLLQHNHLVGPVVFTYAAPPIDEMTITQTSDAYGLSIVGQPDGSYVIA